MAVLHAAVAVMAVSVVLFLVTFWLAVSTANSAEENVRDAVRNMQDAGENARNAMRNLENAESARLKGMEDHEAVCNALDLASRALAVTCGGQLEDEH